MEILNVVIVLIGVAGTLINGLLLLIFLLNPLNTFRSNSTYFIKSLTTADFLTSLVTILWAVSPFDLFRRICSCILWISIQASFYTVFTMSIERYIAVRYPFKKNLIITKKRTFVCIFVTWFFSAVLSGLSEIESIRHQVQFSLYSLFDLVIIGVAAVYIKIIVTLKKASKETNRRRSVLAGMSTEDSRLLNVVTIVVAILFFAAMPYVLVSQIYMGTLTFCPNCPISKNVVKFGRLYFAFELLNFVVNPIVYAIRLPAYRKSLTALFGYRPRITDCSVESADT